MNRMKVEGCEELDLLCIYIYVCVCEREREIKKKLTEEARLL